MTALNEGYHYIYYRNGSSSSYYYIYLYIYNVTQGTTIKSNGTISNTSYSSVSFYAYEGDVIYVSAYRYNSSYSPSLYLYFIGFSTPSAYVYSTATTLTHEYKQYNLTYGEYFYLPHDFTYPGHNFIGWYDQYNNQITDADGYSLEPWHGVSNTSLYAKFEEIIYDWYLKGTFNSWTSSYQYALQQCDDEIIDTAIHQYKITVELDYLDEFKIHDLGENWIGYSNIEEGGLKDNFYATEENNIVTNVAGSYVIYFKVYTEGYSIYIGSAI